MKELEVNETITFGDLKIRGQKNPDDKLELFIYSDKGYVVVVPSSGNSVRIKSTAQ